MTCMAPKASPPIDQVKRETLTTGIKVDLTFVNTLFSLPVHILIILPLVELLQ